MNLPNKLTMLRVLLIPVFMVLAASRMWLAAGVVFALASLTDYFDGHIARKNNLVTDFGKFADPLADKLLTTTAFLYMMADGVCSPVVLVIILAREFAVSGLRMVAAGAPGGKVIAANLWGKAKTVLQMLTICLYYLGCGIEALASKPAPTSAFFSQIAAYPLCWLVALVTAVSGIKYLWENRQFIQTAK